MKCPRCHAELDGSDRFCPACGYNVEDVLDEIAAAEQDSDEFDAIPIDEPEMDEAPADDEEMTDEAEVVEEDGSENGGAESVEDGEPEATEGDEGAEPAQSDVEPDAEPTRVSEMPIELMDDLDEAPLDEPNMTETEVPAPLTAAAPVLGPEPERVYAEVEEQDYDELGSTSDLSAAAYDGQDEFGDYSDIDDAYSDIDDAYSDIDDAYSMAKAYERGGIKALLRRWKTVLICTGCVIALVVAGASSLEWNRMQSEQSAAQSEAAKQEESSRTPVEIGVIVELPGYNEEHMTPVPLRVVGSASTGAAVDELILLQHPATDVLSLLKGTYIVSTAGPVLSDEGDLFEGTVDSFALGILDDGVTVNGNMVNAADGKFLHFIYTLVEPQNVTDSELDKARAWMFDAEIVNYQQYTDAVIAKRQETVDRLAEEQAAREEAERQAAEEAAKKAEELKKQEEEKKKKEEADKNKTTTDDAKKEQDANATTDTNTDTYDYGYDSYSYDGYDYDSGYDSNYWV